MSSSHDHAEHSDSEHGDDYHHHAHIATIRGNAIVFGALLVLTALTVLAYKFRLGEYNLLVAIVIASMKATLVCTWFMHLKYEKRFNILFFLGSFLFVTVFVGYTVNDTGHRGRAQAIQGLRVDPTTGLPAYGTTALIADSEDGRPFTMLPSAEEGEEAEAEEAAE